MKDLKDKLGIKESQTILLINQPEDYFQKLGELPQGLHYTKGAKIDSIDFIHIFVKTKNQLIKLAIKYKDSLKKSGMLWISWPKGKSKIPTDLNRDWIREYMIETGLVDVKILAIDDDWSALKFVYRLKDR